MPRKLSLEEVKKLILEIKKIYILQPSLKHIIVQGEAKRYIPALVNISGYIPSAHSILTTFRDKPFECDGIDEKLFDDAIQEINFLESKRKKPAQTDSFNESKRKNIEVRQRSRAQKLNFNVPTPLIMPKKRSEVQANSPQGFSGVRKIKPEGRINFDDDFDSNTYQVYIPLTSRKSFDISIQIIEYWLNEKKINIKIDKSCRINHGDSSYAEVLRVENSDLRVVTIFEKYEESEFHTEIIMNGGDEPWLWIRVEPTQDLVAMPPRFVSQIIRENISWVDSRKNKINYVNSNASLDYLLKRINSGNLDSSLFIIGLGIDSNYSKYIFDSSKKWSDATTGLAEIYLLENEFLNRFNIRIPNDQLRVYPYTMKSFHRGISYIEENSHNKPRMVGSKRLLDRGLKSTNKYLIGRIARRIENEIEIPKEVLQAKFEISKQRNRDLLNNGFGNGPEIITRYHNSITSDSPARSKTSESEHNSDVFEAVEYVFDELGLEFTLDNILHLGTVYEERNYFNKQKINIESTLGEKDYEISSLKIRLKEYRNSLESKENELDDLTDQLQQQQRHISFLQSKLLSTSEKDSAYSYDYSFKVVETFEEALESLSNNEFKYVKFTGDYKVCLRLDELDTNSSAIKNFWRVLHCINDYGRYKDQGGSGNIRSYLEESPNGFQTVPLSSFALHESDTTIKQFGNERLFNVDPSERHPDGKAFMYSHFKINASGFGTKIPRVHLLDDTDEGSYIYIGYIGPHLRVAGTN